jgi:hypothetical protein
LKPEVVTEIEGGLLLQLDGTVTDKNGQPVSESEVKQTVKETQKQQEEVAKTPPAPVVVNPKK